MPTVFVVEDDKASRDALLFLFSSSGLPVRAFASAEEFLAAGLVAGAGCLILDIHLTGMSGFDLLDHVAVPTGEGGEMAALLERGEHVLHVARLDGGCGVAGKATHGSDADRPADLRPVVQWAGMGLGGAIGLRLSVRSRGPRVQQ